MRLILASQSAARRALLEAAHIQFEAIPAHIDEAAIKAAERQRGSSAEVIAHRLAHDKAETIARANPDALVIGSDQVLECADGTLLDKPQTIDRLKSQLALLAGTTHQLHAAAVIIGQGRLLWSGIETVRLTMRPLAEADIATYVQQCDPSVLHCVGGYQIEGYGVTLFDQIEGSYFAILGLPLLPLLTALRTLTPTARP